MAATNTVHIRPLLRRCGKALVAVAAALAAAQAQAQGQAAAPRWPEETVRIVAAGPAGGSADIVARLLADRLSRQIGQPVIVEPKPGAGGVLAVNELSLAPRDGQRPRHRPPPHRLRRGRAAPKGASAHAWRSSAPAAWSHIETIACRAGCWRRAAKVPACKGA